MNTSESPPTDKESPGPQQDAPKGIGCGVFLILVGIGLFAERMGWFPFSTIWFLPAVFIALGIGAMYDAIRSR